ncbi:hypothetical protein D3C85_1045260 [compost metagenome]
MESISSKNITYYAALRVCLRLYGIYLFFTGFLDALVAIPSIYNESGLGMYFFLKNGATSFKGIINLCIGLSLFFFSSYLISRLVDREKEISIKEGELYFIVKIFMKFILLIMFISFLSALLIGLITLTILAITETVNIWDYSTVLASLITPFMLMITTYISIKNTNKIVRILIK